MGIFNSRKEPVPRMPEKAMVKDHLGFWPVDMAETFRTYREKGYIYHGPITMNQAIVHVFGLPDRECE